MTITTNSNADLQGEITTLERNLAEFRVHLRDHSIWLFLATLGCWSVTKPVMQWAALALTALLFGQRIFQGGHYDKTYSRRLSELKASIEKSSLEADVRKARLWDIANLERENLALQPQIWKNWIYWLCVSFYAFTVISMAASVA